MLGLGLQLEAEAFSITWRAFDQLWLMCQLQLFLTMHDLAIVTHALVLGLALKTISKMLFRDGYRDLTIPVLRDLYWLSSCFQA